MRQFPNSITSDITIWVRYIDSLTNNNINVRCVLNKCFWNDDSISVFHKTGQQITNSVTLYIPLRKEITGKQFVTPEEWQAMPYDKLSDYWTFNIRQLPLMAKGDNSHEFTWGTAGAVTTQENQFMTNNPSVRRATDFNLQNFGSVALQHIVIRA